MVTHLVSPNPYWHNMLPSHHIIAVAVDVDPLEVTCALSITVIDCMGCAGLVAVANISGFGHIGENIDSKNWCRNACCWIVNTNLNLENA